MLEIALFGPLRLSHDGSPLPPPALPRTLPLLAYLLLNRDRPIPRAALAFALWPDVPEAEARANLRRHVHALDAALPAAPPDRPWLVRAGATLRWNPDADARLDVAAFEDGLAAGGAAALAAAVEAYRADLLPDLDDDWAGAERERLRQLYVAALGQLVDHHQAAGDLGAAIALAQRRVDVEPWQEGAVRSLMALRFLAGDRTGAVMAYQALKRHLADELGVPPMPATNALFAEVVGGEMEGAAPAAIPSPPLAPVRSPAAAPLGKRPSSLPAPLTPFIGRAELLDGLCRLIGAPDAGARLVTLTGPGGAGKTRLALEAARRLAHEGGNIFSDGVVHVALSAVGEPDDVVAAVADALGLAASVSRPALDDVIDALRGRRMLLVLDNFEQVVAAAPAVGRLLEAAAGVRVLTTSRAVLQLYGEHEVPVPPMALPDPAAPTDPAALGACEAVALFAQRARASDPSFALTPDNAAAVADLCVRLDGLPLAIELAAAHIKLFDPATMTERLAELPFVAGTRAVRRDGRPDRHATLKRAVDWSFALLEPAEQALFVRLSVFADGFRIEAVEAVAAGSGAGDVGPPLYALSSLVDQSMVLPAVRGPDGAPRFRLLRTIREYAIERAALDGVGEAAWRALAGYVHDAVRTAREGLNGPDPAAQLVRLDAEYDDVRAVLQRCVAADAAEEGLRLALELEPYWLTRGQIVAARRRMEALLALPSAAAAPARADALRMVARLARRQGDRATSRALAAESRDLSEAAGDDLGVARSLLVIATEGAVADWAPTVEDSLERFRRAGDLAGVARALQSLGNAVSYQGDYVAARTHFEQSVAIRRAIGELWGLEDLLNNLGVTAFGLGQLEAARALHEEALAMRRRIGSAPGIAQSELNLASIDVAMGDAASARDRLRAMLPRHIEHDARIGLVECMEWTACVAAQCGDAATALVLFGAADAARAVYADPLDRMFVDLFGRLRALAEAALAPDAAAAALAEGRTLSHARAVERTARYLGAG